jgi:tRNA(Ile)-lysidine synthetase-like protein
MEPYGMEGSKKLQDIFTDLKIPKAQRESWPVVECGGEIIWLPGYRIARGWELSSDSEPALHLFSDAGSGLWQCGIIPCALRFGTGKT